MVCAKADQTSVSDVPAREFIPAIPLNVLRKRQTKMDSGLGRIIRTAPQGDATKLDTRLVHVGMLPLNFHEREHWILACLQSFDR